MINAAFIEWVWLGVAAIGWVIKLFLFASARANYRHYRDSTPIRVFMARSMYYHHGHMMMVFTVCVTAAFWAVTHQPPPPPIYETQSFMIAVFFLSLTLALTAHALMEARWWTQLEDGYYNGVDDSRPHKDTQKSVVTVETKITSTEAAPAVHVEKKTS